MDAVVAFLNSKIDSDIYIKLLSNWHASIRINIPNNKYKQVAKLLKALYKLKQSPRLQQSKLQIALNSLGFKPLITDNYIYQNAKTSIILVTYVNDFLIVRKKEEEILELKKKLRKLFEIKDLRLA